jgi:cyclic 2,3-diphosphoglycerate synthetase
VTAAIVLIDGEHYPPVVLDAIERLQGSGYEIRAALFLGGTEKTDRLPDLGMPVVAGPPEPTLSELIDRHRPAVVLDLSDEPVLDYRSRLRLAATALQAGVAYAGGGFHFDPPPTPRLTSRPTVSVIGTGKRTGKTAVSIALSRHWRESGRSVCIVTMGRGGPPEPVSVDPATEDLSPPGLLRLAAGGLHVGSDYLEDAALARVPTVGTRRCGAGLAGSTVDDNFHLGVSVAEGLHPDVLVYEGSGTALPPAASDAVVLVADGRLDPEYLRGYFGPFRLRLADAVVIVSSAGAEAATDLLAGVATEMDPEIPVFVVRYRTGTDVDIASKRVLVVTTAPPTAAGAIRADLVGAGAADVDVIATLADRKRLPDDLAGLTPPDLVLTEIKAAVDVVIDWATQSEVAVGYLDNGIEPADAVGEVAKIVEQRWEYT